MLIAMIRTVVNPAYSTVTVNEWTNSGSVTTNRKFAVVALVIARSRPSAVAEG
jgi:hypothetical protein